MVVRHFGRTSGILASWILHVPPKDAFTRLAIEESVIARGPFSP
jgi:hypothetical protein